MIQIIIPLTLQRSNVMYTISGYPMLASTATTLMLSVIFMLLSNQSGKRYMQFWGASWFTSSIIFIIDFCSFIDYLSEMPYIMMRQLLALLNAYLFLFGTYHFFQKKLPKYFHILAFSSAIIILSYPVLPEIYSIAFIPNIILCSSMIIISGCMFISMSWTQKLPEKMLASFLIITYSIYINHFGFALRNSSLAMITYYIGLFIINLLILTLIIIYFKKLRFNDKRNSQRFRLLVENSSDSMFLYDYEQKSFEYISPEISKLINLTDKQLYDMPDRFFDYINVEEKDKNIINIFSRPVSVPGNGVLCLYKNGEIEKWSEIHYIPIKDSTGTVSAVEGILRDITERKKMEEQVKLNENEKREFLENISHEIKTPITLIKGYTESMLDKLIPKESTDTYLKIINSKAMMLTTLLDDLVRLTDFTSQTMEYKFYEQSAADMFSDLIKQSEFHIISSNHIAKIDINISPDAIIIADQYRMQQVILNIINNAIRHTPLKGTITVICRSYFNEELLSIHKDDYNIPKGEIVFSVSDTGDGIPERDLPHIFERNFSGGNRIKKSSEKTGLGLYISKQIITQHSGSMFARNNADGGTEISFTIPYYN